MKDKVGSTMETDGNVCGGQVGQGPCRGNSLFIGLRRERLLCSQGNKRSQCGQSEAYIYFMCVIQQ